jgi:hypothetical protein
MLAVGSYDEVLRLYDTRQMRQTLSELSCGSGLWRIKWQPCPNPNPNLELLAVACMRQGFLVVELDLASLRTLTLTLTLTLTQSCDSTASSDGKSVGQRWGTGSTGHPGLGQTRGGWSRAVFTTRSACLGTSSYKRFTIHLFIGIIIVRVRVRVGPPREAQRPARARPQGLG